KLVRELVSEGAVVYVATREAGLERLDADHVGKDWHQQVGVGLVGVEPTARRLEVEVGRVTRGGNGIRDLRAELVTKLVTDRERQRAVRGEREQIAGEVGARGDELIVSARSARETQEILLRGRDAPRPAEEVQRGAAGDLRADLVGRLDACRAVGAGQARPGRARDPG